MLALFKPAILKLILLTMSAFYLGLPASVVKSVKAVSPSIRFIYSSRKDSLEAAKADSVAQEESRKSRRDRRSEEGKTVRISITDDGIKVGSEHGEDIIVDLDLKELDEQLDRFREQLEGLPESLVTIAIDDLDGRRFREIKGKDIVRFADDIHIEYDEMVRGGVVAIFGDVEIEGKVMGDVVSILGNVDLSSDAIVNGEVVTVLGELTREDGAMVRGDAVEVGPGGSSYVWELPPFGRGLFGFASRIIIFIVGLLLLGIVLAFLPDRMKRSSKFVFGSFFKSLGIGVLVFLVGSIVVTIFAVILSITIVGIPVAVLMVLSFIALCIMGYFVSALALGRLVVKRFNMESESPYFHGFVGLFLLSVLGLISGMLFFNPFMHPFRMLLKSLGGFISLLALFTGIGAFIISKAGTLSTETKPTLPE